MNNYKILESSKEEIDYIEDRICEYNESNVPFEAPIPASNINRHIQDDSGNIIAGVNCIYYAWKCIYIDALWVKEEYRNRGLGSELLKEIEKTAKEYGCHMIHLDTFDFQRKDFYIRQGYEIHGILDDCPQGHKRYYLKKRI
ncbi:GNAT family N-acetyltransferase [Alloiococcus sp. CFN-8]|uniref:GNAT family N-acetyltransferase n=1 Tax=Alloiococcus sp. CFN-8 TaxID=3416081 RepID=UPI003CF714E8